MTGKEFLDKHRERIAELLEGKIARTEDQQLTARANSWHTIEKSCREEIAELEVMLSELEAAR